MPVAVEGLPELRRALRGLENKTVRKSLRDEGFRKAAELVAERARPLAPARSGRLRESIRGTTSGFRGVVRSSLPYANVIQWGGTTGKGHRPGVGGSGSVKVTGSKFVIRAFDANRQQVAALVEAGIYRVAAQQGWEVKR